MSVRKHPTKGPGWWQISISHGRKQKQDWHTYQGSYAEALAYDADLRGVPTEAGKQKATDVIGRFLDWYAVHRSANSLTYMEKELPKVIARLGDKFLSVYRQADYTRYKQGRAVDGVSKRTTNIELLAFSSMLKYADEQLHIGIGDKPQLYPRKQTRPPAKQPLTAEETGRLIAELQGDKKTIVMLYAYCGLRRDEALTLTRGQVDLDRNLLQIRGKGDKPRLVPIVSTELLQALTSNCQGKGRDQILFVSTSSKPDHPQPYKNIKKALKSAAQRAGIDKPVYNHLLRHSAATNAVIGGVNIRALQEILGHSDIRTTELYTHMAADVLRSESQKMTQMHDAAKSTSVTSVIKKPKKGKVIQMFRRSAL